MQYGHQVRRLAWFPNTPLVDIISHIHYVFDIDTALKVWVTDADGDSVVISDSLPTTNLTLTVQVA